MASRLGASSPSSANSFVPASRRASRVSFLLSSRREALSGSTLVARAAPVAWGLWHMVAVHIDLDRGW
jgi:hypothetical protein